MKGRWLLTAAYDSRRDLDDRRSAQLFGAERVEEVVLEDECNSSWAKQLRNALAV